MVVVAGVNPGTAGAADKPKPSASPAPMDLPSAEAVDVNKIKEKYWAKGSETEIGVVQNRLYSKQGRVETGLFYATISSDPFLSMSGVGGEAGYHFSEYFSAHLLGWKHFVSSSRALQTFESEVGFTTNTNRPYYFFGVEGRGSIMYGKLSFVGKSIIYFDLHLQGGLGLTKTETGRYVTPFLGIGQQIYLSQSLTLRLDFRTMYYKEAIVAKSAASGFAVGQFIADRANWTNTLTLGVSYFLNSSPTAGPPTL